MSVNDFLVFFHRISRLHYAKVGLVGFLVEKGNIGKSRKESRKMDDLFGYSRCLGYNKLSMMMPNLYRGKFLSKL